jgi:hypothetical protein
MPQKFNAGDAVQGAKHSNTQVLRGFATKQCAPTLDYSTLIFPIVRFQNCDNYHQNYKCPRNSMLGMQCEAQNIAILKYCEALQRSNAPQHWIYGVFI